MDRFQIVEITEQFNHAGTKATADISVIAEKLGFSKLAIQMRTTKEGSLAKVKRQLGYFCDWNACYSTITNESVVLLQHPFHYPQLTRRKLLHSLKRKKHVKFISIVHDVEELRTSRFNDYYKREFEDMLELADVIIVHNDRMKHFFEERGVEEDKLVNLEIFDYLQENVFEKKVLYEKSITIAGNLDTTKCQYILQFEQLDGVKVNLYGPNFNKNMMKFENVEYHGSFPADEIPSQLKKGFGLVWDGESIDGCKGGSGNYLKYNNPHKLSLYLSSGIPVVIWDDAAEAAFVKKSGTGICVKRLTELENVFSKLTEEDYMNMVNNVKSLSAKLQAGFYTNKAIKTAIEKISL